MATEITTHEPRSPMVVNLTPGMTEIGKIKIGKKGETRQSKNGGEYQLPQKLDHFVVTTLERGSDENYLRDEEIHNVVGDKPTRLKIRLLFDDPAMNFQSRYVAYAGKTMFCTGDGKTASRLESSKATERIDIVCPCDRIEREYKGENKCKINGALSVMLDAAPVVGGVWKLRTTSFNSVQGLMSSLALIRQITGGVLAGIPLDLTLNPKTGTLLDGTQQLVYVVGIEYAGGQAELQQVGYEIARARAEARVGIEEMENQARAALALPYRESEEEAQEAIAEFYPEEAAAAAGAKMNGRASSSSATPSLAAPGEGDEEPAHDPETGEIAASDAEPDAQPEPGAAPEPDTEPQSESQGGDLAELINI